MKALEILKKERQVVTHVDGISLDEAISELAALQYNYESQEIIMADLKLELEALKSKVKIDL